MYQRSVRRIMQRWLLLLRLIALRRCVTFPIAQTLRTRHSARGLLRPLLPRRLQPRRRQVQLCRRSFQWRRWDCSFPSLSCSFKRHECLKQESIVGITIKKMFFAQQVPKKYQRKK
eukprot:PhF_6_TR7244/c0_g1_i1/m.10815